MLFSNPLFCLVRAGNPNRFISRTYTNFRNPFTRTWNIVASEIRQKKRITYPEHTDIVIVGGGFIGSAVAHAIKSRAGPGLSVIVLEKDTTYKQIQNNLILGTLSQHYSLIENIYLAQYSADFFRNVKQHLNTDIDIQYYPYGRLILASETYAERLEKNVSIQKEHGMRTELISSDEIEKRYPWIDTSGIKLGCISTEGEGVFNANVFFKALIKKNEELGANYINAEVVSFEFEQQRDILMEGIEPGSYEKINKLCYKTPDNEIHTLHFAACILAAGDQTGHIAKLAKIGTADGLLNVALPIGKRDYNIYSIDNNCKELPIGLNTPFIMDTSGLWFRRGHLDNNILCGHIPSLTEPLHDELNSLIQPSLEHRFPGCRNIKINHLNTEIYDFNTYDDTGVLGPHAYHGTLYFAAGFGPLGCQHAPGIGRAVAEMIIDGQFTTIDLTRLGFDRFLTDYPLIEFNVY